MEVTIGGNRLGGGQKNKVHMREYNRSNHDLSYLWRSTMACGTLVPFMKQLMLPGDTFDIDLDIDVMTHPTIGPLFGNYSINCDVFKVPIRLYQASLHMNLLNVGMNMDQIKLPQIDMVAKDVKTGYDIDNQQINPSCILAYLGIRGLGYAEVNSTKTPQRLFNAVPWLAYWDIYKNYYANKQEEIGVMIHKELVQPATTLNGGLVRVEGGFIFTIPTEPVPPAEPINIPVILDASSTFAVGITGVTEQYDVQRLYITGWPALYPELISYPKVTEFFTAWEIQPEQNYILFSQPKRDFIGWIWQFIKEQPADTDTQIPDYYGPPQLKQFPLTMIDDIKKEILRHEDELGPYYVTHESLAGQGPYAWTLQHILNSVSGEYDHSKEYAQEGLGIKTYKSDLFNNWISTEWIDGTDGISAVTAITSNVSVDPVTGLGTGTFTIDELNLSKKIYDMLNRIALSGGSYDDWLDATYTHKRSRGQENPSYEGGLIRTLMFQEVISNSATVDEPLGTLAGRGRVGQKKKGGKIIVKADEPCYVIGIVSITPNIDYSQGNDWDNNLRTMDDFHKPALDEIGFQDLITDQMAWWDTKATPYMDGGNGEPIFKSAGKQPAWINYMTSVNKVLGNFADQGQQMFMTLNRRYEPEFGLLIPSVKDITTYIDPRKFNHIFADTRLDAQNFWTQISVDIFARRKMSAKVIPNL